MRVQFRLKVNIENAMARLGPSCTDCCVRSIIYNAVTSGTQTDTHSHPPTHPPRHTHTHTHTHTPQSVQENDEYKILWDFNVQTDMVIEHRRPGIVCINKQMRECQIIDFAIPGDQNIAIKAVKYQDLRIELQKV